MPSFRATRRAVLAAAVAGAIVLAGCGSSTPPAHQRPHSNLESIFEDEGLLHGDPAKAFALLRGLGVDRVRVYLAWSGVTPDPASATPPSFDAANPAAYPAANWTLYDAIVRDAAASGVGIDLTIGGPPPLWAGGRGAPAHSKYAAEWMPSPGAFGAFVHAVGLRYSGHYVPAGQPAALPRVGFWSIWNEPNYGPYLAPQAIDHSQVEVSPRLYRALLDAAWRSLAATGHRPGSDTILIGETAPRGLTGPNLPGNFSGMVPLRFIRALYCVGSDFKPLSGQSAGLRGCPTTSAASRAFAAAHPALFHAGGFADHPYPDLLPPDVRTPPPVGTGYADFAALDDLENTLDRAAAAYGVHAHLPIYSTEFGYRTQPPGPVGLPLQTAARYLNQAEYLSWSNPRIRSYDQYLLTDPPAGSSTFVTGLRFANGQPKPEVYDAYLMPLFLPVTRAPRGSVLQVWGCVRPAPFVRRGGGGMQRVAVQFAPRGTQRFRTLRSVSLTDPHGYFEVRVRFPSSGLVRLAWRHGGVAVSRTEAIKEP